MEQLFGDVLEISLLQICFARSKEICEKTIGNMEIGLNDTFIKRR